MKRNEETSSETQWVNSAHRSLQYTREYQTTAGLKLSELYLRLTTKVYKLNKAVNRAESCNLHGVPQ
eukprot:2024448-Amphidinium_carterae.1